MTANDIVIGVVAWFLGSIPVALLVGSFIAFGAESERIEMNADAPRALDQAA